VPIGIGGHPADRGILLNENHIEIQEVSYEASFWGSDQGSWFNPNLF
jgi:hypothetical protein